MTSNIDRLLAILKNGDTVTKATALVSLKISNLTAEIATLRRRLPRGHRIETVRSIDGAGDRYTKYVYRTPKPRTAAPAARTAPAARGRAPARP